MHPLLARVNGSRPDSNRSILSGFSLSRTDDMSIDFGSFRSIASTDLLPPHEVANDRERDDERQGPAIGPLILSFERVSTGDSVVPLAENIRVSSTEWVSHDFTGYATETMGTANLPPSQVSDYVDAPLPFMRPTPETTQVYPTSVSSTPTTEEQETVATHNIPSIASAITLMNENMRGSSSRWVQDFQQDASNTEGSVDPSIIFPEPELSTSVNVNLTPASSITSTRIPQARQPRSISPHAVEPTDNDILFGRGGSTNTHPGNIHLREVALELRQVYTRLTKAEKYDFSIVLLERMKNENRRFLEKSPLDRLWHEVDDEGARKKVSQALRERLSAQNRGTNLASG
jgi:hypothetical protein